MAVYLGYVSLKALRMATLGPKSVDLPSVRVETQVLGRLNKEMGKFLGLLRFKSQPRLEEMGPMSKILNQTSPEPSKATVVVGILSIYTNGGPS